MLYLFLLAAFLNTATQTDIGEEEIDRKKVEAATVAWADSTFLSHEEYKFTYFKPFYTDEYFIYEMRIGMYKERIAELDDRKENGVYDGTEEKFEAERKTFTVALEKAKAANTNFDRAESYLTHFWTNIQTDDGITVYYEIIVELNNDYQVVKAIENSSIGKKEGASKIVYQKDTQHIKVQEKN